jgi:ribosomal-protein-alanine N-acetyltransferase
VKPHLTATTSYFIGEKDRWGRRNATEPIRLATRLAFDKLGPRRLQAGLYKNQQRRPRALEKAGYHYEATFKKQLQGPKGWENHLWYCAVADSWNDPR